MPTRADAHDRRGAVDRTDADLVRAAVAGDRVAFGELYDRYGNVVYTVCVRLLGNRDDAADCAADVFLKAAERLHQLREPDKVKAWLYAIARNEVARRHRLGAREVVTDDVGDQAWTPVLEPASTGMADPDEGGALPAAALGQLLREATAGLTDRDRVVAELGIAQGLQGQDLADALGVTTNNAYVLVHRVRGRLERSVTAVLVARHGRDDCQELAHLLRGWSGDLTVVLRKRVARHIDRCDVCGRRRRLVPAALFDAAPVLAAPVAVRARVMDRLELGAGDGPAWSRDGFPPADRDRWRSWFAVVAVLVVALLTLTIVGSSGPDPVEVAAVAPRAPVVGSAPAAAGPPVGPGPGAGTGSTTIPAPAEGTPAPTTAALDGVGPAPLAAPTTTPAPDPGGSPQVDAGPGLLTVSPLALDFGPSAVTRALLLSNTGGAALEVVTVASTAAVSVSPSATTLAPGATVEIVVALDRAALADGAFAATIAVRSAAGELVVPVAALGARAPTIVSVSGPSQFGAAPAVNCAFDVVASDDTGVAAVRIDWRLDSGTTSGTTTLAPSAGHWRGQQTIAGPPTTVRWRVVVVDLAGNETTSAELATPLGSVCTA